MSDYAQLLETLDHFSSVGGGFEIWSDCATAIRDLQAQLARLESRLNDQAELLLEAESATAAANARADEAIERCARHVGNIGADWKAAGDILKFYAADYLVDAILILKSAPAQEGTRNADHGDTGGSAAGAGLTP